VIVAVSQSLTHPLQKTRKRKNLNPKKAVEKLTLKIRKRMTNIRKK
jgi:hypothetical protein